MQRIIFCLTVLLFISCELVDDNSDNNIKGEWLIPKDQVFDGGPGKDGIPAISEPNFTNVSEADFIQSEDLVIIAKYEDNVHIYPHRILDWHEIVNDRVNTKNITISYCPLTGSSIGMKSTVEIDGFSQNTTFGVSGLLYNSNLILYDRSTDSYWSQMTNMCVAGKLIGQDPDNVHLVETTWQTAKQMFPNAKVLSDQTGIYSKSRYEVYPYGNYRTDNQDIRFPVNNIDNRLPGKERVLGVVIDSEAKAYRFDLFQPAVKTIIDTLAGKNIVIIGSKADNFITAFHSGFKSSESRIFTSINNSLPIIMEDNQENIYNIFGEVIQGPDSGKKLKQAHNYIAFWFAWAAFYPQTDIVQ